MVIKSPNYPYEYGNNVRCGWDITAKPGYDVWLKVLDYDVSYKTINFRNSQRNLNLSAFQVWPYGSSIHNGCPNHARIGNGKCDMENFDVACNYDGGDCCPNVDRIGDGICDEENKIEICDFDDLDCCQNWQSVGDRICNAENNHEYCDFDASDCCVSSSGGNGICDDINNNPLCGPYDQGDCCLEEPITDFCTDCKCHEDAILFRNVSQKINGMFQKKISNV